MMISQKKLMELVEYDPNTGVFTLRKKTANRVNVGDEAGYIDKSTGYRKITLLGQKYLAHRLAFLYMKGSIPKAVDHINRIKNDNSWDNLRPSNQTINCRNMPMNKNNSSGVNGVYWSEARKKWIAQICLNNRPKNLGGFDVFDDAVLARKAADRKYGFTDNHGMPA